MEIMSFTGKELATQEKSVWLFQFQYHSYNGSWRNLSLPKWLNFSRSLVSDFYLFAQALKTSRKNNVKNCINTDLICLIDLV